MNPRIEEKVKEEIDQMLKAGVFFPVEESEWISPIVKKIGRGNSGQCGILGSECASTTPVLYLSVMQLRHPNRDILTFLMGRSI